MSLIHLKDVNKTYQGAQPLHVLKGIDLDIERGEFVSIMGASGSGKSTLLNILGILDNYDTGEYRLNDVLIKDLSETRAAEYRNKMIGFIFQSFNLIGDLTVYENVELPLTYRGMPAAERRQRAPAALERVGMGHRAKHLPSQLSGGQQQRVAVARALVNDPAILLADEPTGALDSATGRSILELFGEINARGTTLVVVTHDPAIGEGFPRVLRLRDGRLEGGAA